MLVGDWPNEFDKAARTTAMSAVAELHWVAHRSVTDRTHVRRVRRTHEHDVRLIHHAAWRRTTRIGQRTGCAWRHSCWRAATSSWQISHDSLRQITTTCRDRDLSGHMTLVKHCAPKKEKKSTSFSFITSVTKMQTDSNNFFTVICYNQTHIRGSAATVKLLYFISTSTSGRKAPASHAGKRRHIKTDGVQGWYTPEFADGYIACQHAPYIKTYCTHENLGLKLVVLWNFNLY